MLRGLPCAWFSPSYKTSGEAWRELKEVLRPVVRDSSEQDRRLSVRSGGSVEVWSLDDPDAGRGRCYGCVVVDEAAQVGNLEHAWGKSIRPMLADLKGSAWLMSTPLGVANHFYTLFRKGQGLLSGSWKSWQLPTSSNPFIAPDEIEDMRQDMTEMAYAQEVLAQFVSWEGQVFRKIGDAILTGPTTGKAAVIGCDWGRTNDFTVFVVVSDAGEILALDRFRQIEYSMQRDRLRALWERYGKPSVLSESNSMGGVLNEQLRRDGIPVRDWVTSNASKAEAIGALQLAFEQGTIRIPDDPVLIGELQSFEGKPLPGGLMRYQAPDGGHDDLVMALCIAWQGVAGRKHKTIDFEFIRAVMQGNLDISSNSDGSEMDRLPHEYPMGGRQSTFNTFNRRWSN